MPTAKRRAEQIATFYHEHADRIHRRVAGRVHGAAEQTVEDACQHAWTILLRRDDITLDDRAAAWLTTVAMHRAWRLASIAREVPMGAFRGSRDYDEWGLEMSEPPSLEFGCDEQAIDRTEHDERLTDFAALKDRERRELYLRALGYSYREIAEMTDSTYTAINRRISEGRAKLARLADDRDPNA